MRCRSLGRSAAIPIRVLQTGLVISRAAVGLLGEKVRCFCFPARRDQLSASADAILFVARTLGGGWIKIAQILSTRHDLFDSRTIEVLSQLQDQCDYLPLEILSSQADITQITRDFQISQQPIAAGVIAQVHRAVARKTGKMVAIKLKKPDVERLIESDLRLIRVGGQLAGRLRIFRWLPLDEIMADVAEKVRQQLDFTVEAQRIEEFRGWPFFSAKIVFPEVYRGHSSRDVLVMSYEEDVKRFNADVMLSVGTTAIEESLSAIFEMIFFFGIVHCDIHPGNLLYRENGEIVFVDFGLVARMDRTSMCEFQEFFVSVALCRGDLAAEIILRTAQRVPEQLSILDFKRDVGDLIRSVAGLTAGEFNVIAFVSALFAVQRKYRICGSSSFFWPIYTLFCFEGFVRKHHPQLDFQKLAVDHIIRRRLGAVAHNEGRSL